MNIKLILCIALLQILCNCKPSDSSKITSDIIASNESLSTSQSDTLAFEITEANNIVFKTAIIDADTLDLYLDTGGTEIVMKHTAIKEKSSFLKDGRNEKYEEVNYDPLEGVYSLKLGSMSWDSLTIYPTTLLPEEADGHFGWNLFEDKVLELDYDNRRMIVHSKFKGRLDDYIKMEIEYINTLICINASILIGDRKYGNRYLFDSGFQRAVVMDKDLREKSDFPDDLPVIKESRLRNSEGTEFINRVVKVDGVCFEDVCAGHVPVQLLSTPNPARFETHILGNELLKRFNTVLDFLNGYIYMKPNSLIVLPYKDAS